MINVKHVGGKYLVLIKNLLHSDNKFFAGKFDTGAVHTIISAGCVYSKNYLINNKYDIEKRLLDENVPIKIFESATGHKFTGYLTYQENINIGDMIIPKFFYYLNLDDDTNRILIGDDFIRFCDFNHKINSDIVITKLDTRLYEAEFNYKDSGSILSCDDILMRTERIENATEINISSNIKRINSFNK